MLGRNKQGWGLRPSLLVLLLGLSPPLMADNGDLLSVADLLPGVTISDITSDSADGLATGVSDACVVVGSATGGDALSCAIATPVLSRIAHSTVTPRPRVVLQRGSLPERRGTDGLRVICVIIARCPGLLW